METHSLYNGTVKLTFFPNDYHERDKRHTYWHNGQRLATGSGVPKLLDKPALRYWIRNQTIEGFEKGTIHEGREISLAGSKGEDGLRLLDEVERHMLLEHAKGKNQRYKETAAMKGTIAHEWLEEYINAKIRGIPTPNLPDNEGIRQSVQKVLDWEKENEVRFISSERLAMSKRIGCAGTVDKVMMYQDFPAIGDFKTGKTIARWNQKTKRKEVYIEPRLQISAYLAFLLEEGVLTEPRARRMIFHIPIVSGEFKVYDLSDRHAEWYDDFEASWECFKALREAHRYVKGF